MNSIAITGASGFIGKNLCQYFKEKNFDVYALQRNIDDIHTPEINYVNYDLGSSDLSNLPKTNYLIHAAYLPYNKNNNSNEVNFQGTKNLIEICRKNDTKFIFISSLSSQKNALSNYGKTKFNIESLLSNEDLIVVPGLVIGNGGLFYEINKFVKKSFFMPIFGNGNQTTYTVSIFDLCSSIFNLIYVNCNGKKYLFNPERITLKDIYQSIANQQNKKIFFIKIPFILADIIFGLLDLFPKITKSRKESYLGIKQSFIIESFEKIEQANLNFLNLNKSIALLDN